MLPWKAVNADIRMFGRERHMTGGGGAGALVGRIGAPAFAAG